MPDKADAYAAALTAQFKADSTQGGRYGVILAAIEGFVRFIHHARLEQEAFALSDPNPSRGRTEGIIQSEQLADFENQLKDLQSDLAEPALVEDLAMTRLQHDEPAFYHRITRQ